MLVQAIFTIHPENKEKAKEELQKAKAVIQMHGGRNLKYYASMTSGTPNRMFTYEIDKFAHFDALNTDKDYQAIKLDYLYSEAVVTIWGEVAI